MTPSTGSAATSTVRENIARFIDVNLRLPSICRPARGSSGSPWCSSRRTCRCSTQHYDVPNQANINRVSSRSTRTTPTPSLAAWRHPVTTPVGAGGALLGGVGAAEPLLPPVPHRPVSARWSPPTVHVLLAGYPGEPPVAGIVDATMSHDEGWHVRPPRPPAGNGADKTSRMLRCEVLLLLPAVSDVGTARRPAVVGAPALGERPRGVSGSGTAASRRSGGPSFLLLDRYFPPCHPPLLLERRTRA